MMHYKYDDAHDAQFSIIYLEGHYFCKAYG